MSELIQNKGFARDLTTGSIVGNLLRLSFPIMVANFLQTVHNLVDAFWLGKLGEGATSAVAVTGNAFPVVFLLISFGMGFVVAGTALIARYEGAGRPERVKRTVAQLFISMFAFTAIFLIFSLIFIDKILVFISVPVEIYDSALTYLKIIIIGMATGLFPMVYQAIAHGTGDTITPMIISAISVLINIVLDPLMIFGLGFFPRMEVTGAAYATLIAQALAAVISIIFFFRLGSKRIPAWSDLKPDPTMLKNIFRIAIPSSVGQSVTSLGFFILQGFVNRFGTVVISTFAIANRMTSIFMMPAMGISSALATVVGQNLGAGNIDRAIESFRKAFWLIMAIMSTGSAIVYLFGGQFTGFFIDNPEVVQVGVRMFRVSALATWIFGSMFVFMGIFNGSGHSSAALRVNIARLWLFRIPMVYILSGDLLALKSIKGSIFEPLFSLLARPLAEYPYDALWWSMVFSNIFATIWCYIIYKKGKWKTMRFD